MNRTRRSSLEAKQSTAAYFFIAIPCLYFLVFKIAPTVYSLCMSFTNWQLLSGRKDFIGFANYTRIFNTPVFRQSIGNTFKYILVCVPVSLVISLGIAFMLNDLRKGKVIFRTMVFTPYVTSAVAVSFVWKWMFMEQGGLINAVIRFFGIQGQPFLNSPNQAIFVVMSLLIWGRIGFCAIIFIAGLSQIPLSYYEAASIDGANKAQQFWYITLNQLKPTTVYLVITGTISSLQIFTQIRNINPVGGPLKSTTSMVLEIYLEAFNNHNMGRASAMTVVLFAIILLITIFQMSVLNKE